MKRVYKSGKDHVMYKHGLRHSRLYNTWCRMKSRCEDINDIGYHNYGGRVIRVCEEWHDASVFIDWAINHGYEDGLTIDRIDNNGNYEPLNCQFITRAENTKRRCKKPLWGVYKTRCHTWQVTVTKRIDGIDKFFHGGNYLCIALALMKRDLLKSQIDTL